MSNWNAPYYTEGSLAVQPRRQGSTHSHSNVVSFPQKQTYRAHRCTYETVGYGQYVVDTFKEIAMVLSSGKLEGKPVHKATLGQCFIMGAIFTAVSLAAIFL